MALARSRARVLATFVAGTLLVAGTAYGVGVAIVHSPASAGPELSPRIARPVTSPTTSPTPVEPVETPTAIASPTEVSTSSTDDESPSAAPTPTLPTVVLRPGDKGEQVRELQNRLYQLAWLPEVTTGVYDATTKEAVQGFQVKRRLKATGVLDRTSWRKLKAMTKTPSHDAMFNVFHPGPPILEAGASGDQVRDAQARLKQIAWIFGDVTGTYDRGTVQAVRGFQEKRQIPVTGKIDRRTLDRLHAMTVTPSHEELFNIEPKPGALDPRCRTGRVICVDKTSRTVRWVVDGKVQLTHGRAVRLDGQRHPHARRPVPRLLHERRPRLQALRLGRCPTRCSSPEARPCTTPRTSPPSATTAPRTAA